MLQVLQCGMLFTLLDIPANSNVIYCILLYFHLFQDDATLTSDILNLMWFILFCLLAIIEFKALCQSSWVQFTFFQSVCLVYGLLNMLIS